MSQSANAQQVGGTHYKGAAIEHWDFVHQLNLDYFQGNITKYVSRWRKKNGVTDLRKAAHYLDKYIELAAVDKNVGAAARLAPQLIEEAVKAWGLQSAEEHVVTLVCEWEQHLDILREARKILARIIDDEVNPGEDATRAYVAQ